MYLHHKEVSFCVAVFIICFNIVTVKADCSAAYVAIKSTSGDLYLDTTNRTAIQIQNYGGSYSQLWRIDCGHIPGLFRLYNYLHGAFLGVTPFPSTNPPPLILDDVAQDYWQEWFLNGNGRITNAAVLHQLDITASEFKPGTLVGLFRDTGNPNQEWEIENIAKDKSFQKMLGGPDNYEIHGELPTGPGVLKNVGFGTGERFHSPIKGEKLPPGSHTIKKLTTKFSKTPILEWGGFSSRFKSTEPAYRQAPNRYNVPHYSIIDKKVSKRGPYDTFRGPRDQTTIKNHFAPALFKTPDIMYNVPSALDHLLHNPSKKRYGKFLQDERFPEGASIMATKNGLTMYMRDAENPGPAIYNPYAAA